MKLTPFTSYKCDLKGPLYLFYLAITFSLLSFSSCSKKIEVVEHITPPIAEFTYSLSRQNDQIALKLKSHSLNATSWKWTIDSTIELTTAEAEVMLKPSTSYAVKLEVSNPAGSSVSERTIYYSETSLTPTVKNVSYSWWCDPISIYYNNNNYFSGVDSLGRQMLFCYNLDHNRLNSRIINSGYKRDEHNSPSFIIYNNNIITAFTGHDEDHVVRVKKVSLNLDAESASKSVAFPSSTSYSQLFEDNGRIFLTTRCISQWYISWSDNGGDTWSQPVTFFEKSSDVVPGAFYIRPIVVSPDKIIIGTYMHPTTAGDKLVLYYAAFNPQTGDIVKEDNSLLGNLYAQTSNGVFIETLDTIYAATPGNTFRFLDIALQANGKTAFLIATTSTTDYVAGDYIFVERDHENHKSSLTKIIAHGNDLPHDTYWGGAYFVVDHKHLWNNEVYLARENKKTWYVEKYSISNGNVSFQKQIEAYYSSDRRTLSRPLPPIGSTNGGLSMIYQKGEYYDFPSYTNWRNMELVMVAPDQTVTSVPEITN